MIPAESLNDKIKILNIKKNSKKSSNLIIILYKYTVALVFYSTATNSLNRTILNS